MSQSPSSLFPNKLGHHCRWLDDKCKTFIGHENPSTKFYIKSLPNGSIHTKLSWLPNQYIPITTSNNVNNWDFISWTKYFTHKLFTTVLHGQNHADTGIFNFFYLAMFPTFSTGIVWHTQ